MNPPQVYMPFSKDLPDPGIEPRLLSLLQKQVDSLPLVTPAKPF